MPALKIDFDEIVYADVCEQCEPCSNTVALDPIAFRVV